jgi:transcriptional regulator with XRE-family HTH domain
MWAMIPWYKLNEPALAEALKEIIPIERRRERITTHALARRAEVENRYIQSLERGTRPPSIALFIVLAWALDLDPRDLFDRLLKRMNYPEGSRPVLSNRAAADVPAEAQATPGNSGSDRPEGWAAAESSRTRAETG